MYQAEDLVIEGLFQDVDFDVTLVPPAVKPVVFLSGSLEEMGRQYGVRVKELIKRNVAMAVAEAKGFYDSHEKLIGKLREQVGYTIDKFPKILEMWEGIAEGAGVSFEQIALLNNKIPIIVGRNNCSGIAAWGACTENGDMLAASNVDTSPPVAYYGVVLIARPENYNSFITSIGLAGQICGGAVLNGKGVHCFMTGSQAGRPEDLLGGFDPISALGVIGLTCESLKEAERMIEKLKVFGSSNYILAHKEEGACAFEYTTAEETFRYSGDFGENDYLIIANHFVKEEMKAAHFKPPYPHPSLEFKDSYIRYRTEEKMLLDNFGKNDPELMMGIMSAQTYLEDGQMKERNSTGTLENSSLYEYSPNMSSDFYQSVDSTMAYPKKGVLYIRHGCKNSAVSFVPGSYSGYARFLLGESDDDTLIQAENDAREQMWLYTVNLKSNDLCTKMKLIKMKNAFWQGKNCVIKKNLEKDAMKIKEFSGKAMELFTEVQLMAKEN